MDYRDELAQGRDSRRKSEDHRGMKVMLFVLYEDDGTEKEIWVPAKYEVCDACNGRGKYVNPGIDSGGITGEEMSELGDDFLEDYMGGTYDVTCDLCDGRNVMLTADDSAISKDIREKWYAHEDEQASYEAELAAERRFGA